MNQYRRLLLCCLTFVLLTAWGCVVTPYQAQPAVAPVATQAVSVSPASRTADSEAPLTVSPNATISLTQVPLLAHMRRTLHESARSSFSAEELSIIPFLELSGNQMTDLSELAYFPNVTNLSLSSTAVQDFQPLSHLKKLSVLYLKQNAQASLQTLPDLKSLTELHLMDSGLDDTALLVNDASLTTLEIDQSNLPLLTGIKDLPNLAGLTLRWTVPVQSTALAALANSASLVSLTLDGPAESGEPDYAWLRAMVSLQDLSIACTSARELSALPQLPSLTALCVTGPVDSVVALSRQRQLQTLTLKNACMQNLLPLAGLTSLRRLELLDCTVSDLTSLKQLGQLQTLVITGQQPDDILCQLREALPQTEIFTQLPAK